MSANWVNVIRNNMEPLSVVAGAPSTLFIVRDEKTQVWVLTELGEFPQPPPPLDRFEFAPIGCREVTFDVADPDFLVVQKVVGVAEYLHYIPWGKVVDIVFRKVN
jgi:hypothetical protein